MGEAGSDGFDWSDLVPRTLHPTKVAIVEALHYMGHELSPTELSKMFGSPELGLAPVAYHVRSLVDKGALVQIAERQVRGALEKFFYFPASE